MAKKKNDAPAADETKPADSAPNPGADDAKPSDSAPNGADSAPAPTTDEVAKRVAELDEREAELDAVYEGLVNAKHDLDRREADLATREKLSGADQVAERERQLAQAQQQLTLREQDLKDELDVLAQRKSQFEAATSKHLQREGEVATLQEALENAVDMKQSVPLYLKRDTKLMDHEYAAGDVIGVVLMPEAMNLNTFIALSAQLKAGPEPPPSRRRRSG